IMRSNCCWVCSRLLRIPTAVLCSGLIGHRQGALLVNQVIARSMDQEAVEHARVSEEAAVLAWEHLYSEYTQDIDQVLATLSNDVPLTWTLPSFVSGDEGAISYSVGQDLDEIRAAYTDMRERVEIHDWRALLEIRQGWYTLTQGVILLKRLDLGGEFTRGETVTMF